MRLAVILAPRDGLLPIKSSLPGIRMRICFPSPFFDLAHTSLDAKGAGDVIVKEACFDHVSVKHFCRCSRPNIPL